LIEHQDTPDEDEILNPERGFYDVAPLCGAGDLAHVRAAGRTLVYTPVRLDAYRAGPLDDAILAAIEAGFERVRAAGLKSILRFVYNDGPWPVPEPDAPKAMILAHLQQLRPSLTRHQDVVAVVQAGFVGAWGEWHDSRHGLDRASERGEILNAILETVPSSRMVQVRTPRYKEETFGGSFTPAEAFSGSARARIGHHDDCFLASREVACTMHEPVEAWRAYIVAEGAFVAVGGETCAPNPPASDCQGACAELRALHFSYLNALYHPDVLARWRAQGCWAEIQKRLGYRIMLEGAHFPAAARARETIAIQLDLRNDGYASPFNARPAWIVLEQGETRRVLPLQELDVRRLGAGEASTVEARLIVPADAAAGTHQLLLWLPDAAPPLADRPEYALRLANRNLFRPERGDHVLGTIDIR
jgi:hypothetical protein